MVWSHYKNETNLANASHHNDTDDYDDNLPDNVELEYEDWKTWHSDDLYNMWHSLQCYVQDACIHLDVLNFSDYDDFCEFVYHHSAKIRTKNAT
jgi:hypothetical protein